MCCISMLTVFIFLFKNTSNEYFVFTENRISYGLSDLPLPIIAIHLANIVPIQKR